LTEKREKVVLPSKSANRIQFPLSKDATLFVSFLESKTPKATGVLLGPHPIEVQVSSDCANPRFWIRFEGDALVFVRMEQQAADETQWIGDVTFPKPGSYTLRGHWYGCKGDETKWAPFEGNLLSIQTMNQDGESGSSGAHQGIFAKGAWISTKSIKFNDISLHPFMWMSPTVKPTVGSFIKINNDRLIAKDGVVLPNTNFFGFNSLSNYELVCFMGNKTSEKIREEFLAIRPSIFPGQRPFKFHHYGIDNFIQPDRGWDDEKKRRLRKCKQILVSLDEHQGAISQSEYQNQVTKFLLHLVKLLNNPTFPVWMFTVNEPPMNATTYCHSPQLARTSDHPCNDALKDLFRPGVNIFPKNVHLLDNTDVSLPILEQGHLRRELLSIIALRIYVLVGHRVAEWRKAGQIGAIDGLHKNESVEPNFELIPYDWNSN